MWKATHGQEFEGVLADKPRTIGGIVVIDVDDTAGRHWTSPTASRMSDLIVRAMNQIGIVRPCCRIWWRCEGDTKSSRGKPHDEFSIEFRDETGKTVLFEHRVLRTSAFRNLVTSGRMQLAEAMVEERKAEREFGVKD